MKKTFYLLLLIIISCQNIDLEKEKQNLFEIDKEFSDYSEKKGMQAAFLNFIDEDGVLLLDNSLPIKGKNALIELYKNKTDTDFVLTWKPTFAEISKSADLGYTYGFWNYQKDTFVQKGTYLTIWKKDRNGNWKFVLDTGNDDLH